MLWNAVARTVLKSKILLRLCKVGSCRSSIQFRRASWLLASMRASRVFVAICVYCERDCERAEIYRDLQRRAEYADHRVALSALLKSELQ